MICGGMPQLFCYLAISPYPFHPLSVKKLAISPFRPNLETFSSKFGDIFVEDIMEKTKWCEDKSVGDIINGDNFVVNRKDRNEGELGQP